MSDMESRLTEAMKARARDVEPRDEDGALEHITRRVNDRRRRALVIVGVAAAVAVAVAGIALIRRDDGGRKVNVTTKPSTTSTPPSSTTTTTEVPPRSIVPARPAYIWPFNGKFATAQDAAQSFAVDYLGMTLARVGKTIDDPVREVEIFPNGGATARTLVEVAELPDRGWVVSGATADEIKLDHPGPGSALTSPLRVSGASTAFEAQIALELRPVGSKSPVVRTSTMGGSNGEIGPFSTSIDPPSTDQPLVSLATRPMRVTGGR